MFVVSGGKSLEGKVKISGSKNAVLPILAASLLIKGKITLKNVPIIGDVKTFLEIFKLFGVEYSFDNNTLFLDTTKLKNSRFDLSLMKKVRVTILLLAPILYHFGKIEIPVPGGCSIGKRPVDAHLEGLKSIGYTYSYEGEFIKLKGKVIEGDKVINAGFGVTSTENIIVANVLRKGKTTIKNTALEPHVMNLIDFLRQLGADIKIKFDHSIVIEGVEELKNEIEFEVISDYIQSGTYMILGALLAKEYIDIENARIEDLYSFLEKLQEAGVKIEDMGNDTLRVYKAKKIKAVSLQTNIYPGFPTDLQSPFCVLLTQAEGMSKVHEVLFEGRLNWLVELEKIGTNIALLNPHQAMIFGPTKFKAGKELTSWDLRAGAAVLIASLLINGKTKITNIDYIKRGYDDIVANLRSLGASIEDLQEIEIK
ncbi:UDP-N-acetylglucosamine 1-carboxyvinyltransferase [Candidatus Gracilibacteria bacterium]|nr:UDP-N-acetylglucosamine 1-carboxyvinyltransferase [Candidatus Gracilibacteria bacterium]NUJ98537.1 UDP-N-acetylglucosamine 1-carboxyvinyltransferase [Candidatus Gracilibacteria bacterium]